MIAINNKAKTIGKIFHVILNAKLIAQYEIQIKNVIHKNVNMSAKIIAHAKKVIVGILPLVFTRMISI